jgi:hypothetical protein
MGQHLHQAPIGKPNPEAPEERSLPNPARHLQVVQPLKAGNARL